jgi:hypothetical protein
MKKIVRINESELITLVGRILNEMENLDSGMDKKNKRKWEYEQQSKKLKKQQDDFEAGRLVIGGKKNRNF